MNRALGTGQSAMVPGARKFRGLSKVQRAERVRAMKAVNGVFQAVALAVRREFVGLSDWKQLSNSRASVVCRITSAIQGVDTASDDALNKATRTVTQEIYAIEEWPTTKRVVVSRATAAIRRLKMA